MSTTFEIGRWPAASSRALSHIGDGPIRTPSYARAVKRGQRSVASTTTSHPGSPANDPASVSHAGAESGERRAGPGMGRARDAVDAEAVRSVRRDLELEDVGRDRQDAVERLPDHETT